MRVISGTARGKKLNTLSGLNTRPTLDRVKEAVFSIIQFDLEGKNVLDLFSGSGALAIEALSRGANNAVMCDNSYEAIKIIKQNVKETRLIDKVEIINKDYAEALKKLNKEIMTDISLEEALKIINISLNEESLNRILENINIFRDSLIKENKKKKILN